MAVFSHFVVNLMIFRVFLDISLHPESLSVIKHLVLVLNLVSLRVLAVGAGLSGCCWSETSHTLCDPR